MVEQREAARAANNRDADRARYRLVTEWRIDAPLDALFDALSTPADWPAWWRYVDRVEPVAQGDAHGIGAVWRYTWSSRLPYRLTFDMTTTRSDRPHAIEGAARGELSGIGCWRLASDGDVSCVRYTWLVDTGKRWMNVAAPLFAALFAWNHDQVMKAGGEGLARRLGVRFIAHRRLHD
ncbi:MAG TPA: SRPBCC family protein [Casimicrobiaceae bacterium]|nr:SRPBCC family protein [Casimicrobiaceae bacterium]